MKQLLLIIAVVALVGCGKKTTTDKVGGQPVNPSVGENRPEEQLKKLTGELTKADLERVVRLDMRITDVGLKELAKPTRLTLLDLGGSKEITDAGLKEVARLTQLVGLKLSRCGQITDAGVKELAKLTQLKMFRLRRTNITDAGLKEVAKLKQLTHLDLQDTKVTRAGVAELQKALPKCEIVSNPTK